jgi:hypothetical protein
LLQILDLKLNKVVVKDSDSEDAGADGAAAAARPRKEKKTFDLNASGDAFWAANANNPFPKVAGENGPWRER